MENAPIEQNADLTESTLLDLATAMDQGHEVEVPASEIALNEDAAASQSGKTETNPEPENEAKSNDAESPTVSEKNAEAGKSTESKAKEAKEETEGKAEETLEPKPEAKPESYKEKAAKEKARRDDSWKRLEAEKAQLKAERESLERHRQALLTQPKRADVEEFSAKEYEAYARELRDQGDYDLAEKAEAKARTLREAATRLSVEQFRTRYEANCVRLIQEHPELVDRETPLFKAVAEIYNTRSYLQQHPDGIADAVQVAKLQQAAGSVSVLQQKLVAAQKEIDSLNRKLGTKGTSVTTRGPARSFEDMSPEQQEAELIRLAEEADNASHF